jgi:hypothetical protein
MYAGTTIRRHSGWLLGVHQRIDRAALRHLIKVMPQQAFFPSKTSILSFEGNNGPDAIKRKSPSHDEPWHFINPKKPNDRALIDLINDHSANLSKALKAKNNERAAFEAAWLSHAIVDGLTPAHHYPLADKIEELWGKPHHQRTSVRDKNLIKGENRRDSISKNWQYWGSGGIFSRHVLFEFGVATSILFHPFHSIGITKKDLKEVADKGIEPIFRRALKDIAAMHMYERLARQGWTHVLASESREVLVPRIMKTVCLAWYGALMESQE